MNDMLPVNNSKTYYTGRESKTQQGYKITIIGRSSKKYIVQESIRYPFYFVQFDNGYITEIHATNILRGRIGNPMHPTASGIGFLGIGEYDCKTYNKELRLWESMLGRCYNASFHVINRSYKDCTVDPRWHNFQNFCEDIQHLEGYAKWKANTTPRMYALDKDIKVEGNKVYSKDTCTFVTVSENSKNIKRDDGRVYKGINKKTGEEYVFSKIESFSEEHNLISSCVSRVIRGDQNRKQHKGWKFKEITDEYL